MKIYGRSELMQKYIAEILWGGGTNIYNDSQKSL